MLRRQLRLLRPRCAAALALFALVLWGALAPSAACADGPPATAAPLAQSATATGRQDLDVQLDAALDGCLLRAVELGGLHRTIETVVRRELVVRIGRPLRQPALRESVRRLRNLGVFRRVDATVAGDPAACTLVLRFDEKWTLLPIFSLGRGGGITFLTAGVQDIHLLGRLLQLEGYWQLFGGVHSGGIVFADPRLLDKRLALQLSVGVSRRNRARFDADGTPLPGWSRHRRQVGLEFADLRRPERVWRASAWWIDDRFDTSLLPSADRPQARSLGLPARRSWLVGGLGGTWGRIDNDDYLERGHRFDVGLLAGVAPPSARTAGNAPWLRGTFSAKAAWLPIGRLNLVARVVVAQISRPVEEFGLYVGGLDGVRGLPDSRFFGEALAVVNAEARLPSYHGRLFALQHVAFVDVGRAASGWNRGIITALPVSMGTGVRLIVPKVARLVARLDVAWVFERRDGWLVSFGAQQAF